jgi:hypothetical protein
MAEARCEYKTVDFSWIYLVDLPSLPSIDLLLVAVVQHSALSSYSCSAILHIRSW